MNSQKFARLSTLGPQAQCSLPLTKFIPLSSPIVIREPELTTGQQGVLAVHEPKDADERAAAGQKAKPRPPGKGGLAQPDWDSGDVLMTPLPGSANPSMWQWHTWSHNLGSMNLLVDAPHRTGSTRQSFLWRVPEVRSAAYIRL